MFDDFFGRRRRDCRSCRNDRRDGRRDDRRDGRWDDCHNNRCHDRRDRY